MPDGDELLRGLPSVQRLLEDEAAAAHLAAHGHAAVAEALRQVLIAARLQMRAGSLATAPSVATLLARAGDVLAERGRRGLRPVINATGIVLHTNLGRAPLAREALDAVAWVGAGYASLEFDLDQGQRGSRTAAVEALLRRLAGAEAALAVNNGAAAVLLALSALAGGGEVIVSRGELVEIGGGFRIPDVIGQGGARLVEVGTTNRTGPDDYRAAIGPATRVLLKVHPSNFRLVGFTRAASIAELAEIGREHALPVVADLGSGLLAAAPSLGEPTLTEALRDGADLVTCSGDKLLGGPQAGLILGAQAAVDPLRRHPLLRAVRLDKMALAALEATLLLHRDAPERIPVIRMLGQSLATLEERASRLIESVGEGEVVATEGFAGGGALAEQRLPSRGVAFLPAGGAEAAAQRLRRHAPAVIGRIAGGRLLLDMLTVADDELPALAAALRSAWR